MCILTKQNCVQWCWSGQKHGLVDVPFWWFKLSPRDSCLQWFPWIAGWVMFTWDMSHLLTQIVSSGNWRQCSQLLIRRNKNMCISCIWRFILSPICCCFVWGLHWSWLPKCTCRWLQPPVCRGLSPIGGSWELSKGGYDHLLNPCIVPIGHFREVQIVERLFSNVFCSQQSPARWITRNRHNEYSISECDSFIEASGLFVCVCMLVHGSSERKLKLQLHGHVTLSSCWWWTFLCASMMTKAFLGLLRKFLAPQISLKTLPSRVVRQRNLLALQSDFPTNTFEKQLVI